MRIDSSFILHEDMLPVCALLKSILLSVFTLE